MNDALSHTTDRPRRRRHGSCARRFLIAEASAVVALAIASSPAPAAVLIATPSTLTTVFGQAAGGDVIELTTGDYNGFGGGPKSSAVTIRPRASAAVTMSLDFSSASNIRIQGITVTGATLRGTTSHVTIAGSRFTGGAVVDTSSMVNAGIVFDGDTFAGIDACSGCYEGRLQVARQGPGPSGVTIRNCRFGPGGNADGIQINANGVQVLNNEFVGIRQVSEVHSDALQLYGQTHTVIRGNYFHDNDVAIMAPDGGDHEYITDNVMVGAGYVAAVQFGHNDGTVFAHNTVENTDVHMWVGSGDTSPNRNGVLRDNVLVNSSLVSDGCVACAVGYNLFGSSDRASGTNVIVGTPLFAGGDSPASYAGFALAPGSPGKNNASDGTDRGIRIAAPAGGQQPGAGERPLGGRQRTRTARTRLKLPRRVGWAKLRRGLRVRIVAKQRVDVRLRLRRAGARRALAHKRVSVHGKRTVVLRPRRSRLGHRRAMKLRLDVTITERSGSSRRLRRTIRVRP